MSCVLEKNSATDRRGASGSELPSRSQIFSIEVDGVTRQQAVELVLQATQLPFQHLRYVVTPNVDHLVQLRSNERFHQAYDDAWLVLADGWPVVWAARKLGQPLPERVAGSDLVPDLMKSAENLKRPMTLFLLGGEPGVPEQAANAIQSQFPWVEVVGTCSPDWGFERSESANEQVIQQINAASPDVLLVGLGAPKQELWLHRHQTEIRAKVALAAGATIDFFAGRQTRAPRWLQSCGLEWCHRLASNPRRLAGRYLKDAILFPWMVTRELVGI